MTLIHFSPKHNLREVSCDPLGTGLFLWNVHALHFFPVDFCILTLTCTLTCTSCRTNITVRCVCVCVYVTRMNWVLGGWKKQKGDLPSTNLTLWVTLTAVGNNTPLFRFRGEGHACNCDPHCVVKPDP